MAIKNGITLFMHIPKTGGATLTDVIHRFYKEKNRLSIKGVHTEFRKLAIEKSKSEAPFIISGHFGLREVIDIPESFLFTYLRPPVARVISHYYYLKETPQGKYFEYLNQPDASIESFYALKEKRDFDNCLVRFISGCHVDFGKIGEPEYLLALENLQNKFHYFGIQDYYDESLILLANRLKWPLPVYRMKNLTRKKELVSESTISFLKEANHWDMLLFENAKVIFKERMNKMTVQEKNKLKRLRFLNKLASKIPF